MERKKDATTRFYLLVSQVPVNEKRKVLEEKSDLEEERKTPHFFFF